MLAFRRMLVVVLVCWAGIAVAQKQWQQRSDDEVVRVLGPRWRQLSHDSGMIFAGTVLEIRNSRLGESQVIPVVKIRFRVERAIAGVHPRQVLTIREWAGAWSQHPLHVGERVLLLLYPQSRLGLTSPVGGLLGQLRLSATNQVIPPVVVSNSPQPLQQREGVSEGSISLSQLESALRTARGSYGVRASRDRAVAEEE